MLDNGQRERGGLARSGRGLAKDVAARQEDRNRLALNRGRFFVAELGERRDDRRVQSETGEADQLAVDAFFFFVFGIYGV